MIKTYAALPGPELPAGRPRAPAPLSPARQSQGHAGRRASGLISHPHVVCFVLHCALTSPTWVSEKPFSATIATTVTIRKHLSLPFRTFLEASTRLDATSWRARSSLPGGQWCEHGRCCSPAGAWSRPDGLWLFSSVLPGRDGPGRAWWPVAVGASRAVRRSAAHGAGLLSQIAAVLSRPQASGEVSAPLGTDVGMSRFVIGGRTSPKRPRL